MRFSDIVFLLLRILEAVVLMTMTTVAVVHHYLVGELRATVVVAEAMTIVTEAAEVQAMADVAVLVAEAAAMVAVEADMKAEVVNLRFFYLLCHQKSYILYNYK